MRIYIYPLFAGLLALMLLCAGCGSGGTEREAASIAPGGIGTGGVGTNGDLDEGLTGGSVPIDPSQDPFETAEWDIVSFDDPRVDADPYDIIDGRVLIAFKNPPTLPVVDPNYFDVERLETDPVYNQVVHNYAVTTTTDGQTMLSDPAIAAFVLAEDLDVYSEWPMVAGMAAVLPEGQSVADAVLNWPTEYPTLIDSVDPDMIATGCAFPQDPPNEPWCTAELQNYWYLWADNAANAGSYPVSPYSTDIGSLWHSGVMCQGDAVLAVVDSGVDYGPVDLQLSSVLYGINAGDKKASTQFSLRSYGGGEPWEWLLDRSQANATALGHGTCVAGVAAAYTNNYSSLIPTSYFSSVMGHGKYVPLAVKAKGNVHNIAIYSLSSLYNSFSAIGAMKRLPGYTPSTQFPRSYVPYYRIEVCNISIGIPGSGTKLGNRLINSIGDYVLFVAGGGNENSSSSILWPAYNSKVMGVAGHDSNGIRAYYTEGYSSNYQSYLEISAPSIGIRTCDMIGNTSSGYHKGWYEDSESLYWDGFGTSVSAPIVAAAATIVSEHHSWSPAITRWWINANKSYDLPDPTVNQFGRLDAGNL